MYYQKYQGRNYEDKYYLLKEQFFNAFINGTLRHKNSCAMRNTNLIIDNWLASICSLTEV